MQLAFYAPMKSPDHPVPSGDRNIARSLIAALRHIGADVTLASQLQTRDGTGDADQQVRIINAAQAETDRLIDVGKTARWDAWITYHNYYKAPDLIGPNICRALGIPYLQVESTRARKRLTGAWARFAQAAEAATDAAKVVFYLTERDVVGLHEQPVVGQRLVHLHPFLPRTTLPTASVGKGPMLSVGMMRAGDKLASYEIIAESLASLSNPEWRLDIAGDGPAREQVETLMAPFDKRVEFLGQLPPKVMRATYQKASLLLWPGVNEAVGMVYLEAQAAGLPIAAQNRPGMCEVLAPGAYPSPESGALGLAEYLDELLNSKDALTKRGLAARQYIKRNHLLASASQTLLSGLAFVGLSQ